VIDPKTGATQATGQWSAQTRHIVTEHSRPWVVLFYEGSDA
jgi:hypothetical protein